ncbi:MAG: DUF4266 domain-containing protein [Reinekea sp.]|jgi:hypothetical protein
MIKNKLYLFFFACVVLQGCATVQPWERGTLARPEMAFVPDALQSKMQGHIYFSKEAADFAAVGSGGGCGCN